MGTKKNEKKKLLDVMAKNIAAAGYSTIAKQVRGGTQVRKNVTRFLELYKKTQYGKVYAIKADGTIDGAGKISLESRKLYDKVEKWMKRALKLYEENKK